MGWETPWHVTCDAIVNYISSVTREGGVPFAGDKTNGTLPANVLGTNLAAQTYLDLAGTWNVSENKSIRFGINNILDRDPPLSTNTHVGAGAGNGNTFPQ